MNRGIKALVVVFFGSLLLSACLTPLIYHTVLFLAEKMPNVIFSYLSSKRIDHYFDRIRLLTLIIFLPWLLNQCDLISLKKLGLSPVKKHFPSLLKYFFFGIALVVMLLCPLFLWGQITTTTQSLQLLFKNGILVFIASMLIAILEETLFRGILLQTLIKTLSKRKALLWGAFLFAILHFSTPNGFVAHETMRWYDGFLLAIYSLMGMAKGIEWLYFLNLFALGIILGLLFIKTGNLWSSIGLHWGIVCTLLFLRKNVYLQPDSLPQFLGNGRVTDSWLSFCVLGLVAYRLGKNLEATKAK